jgi:hypothetical protein
MPEGAALFRLQLITTVPIDRLGKAVASLSANSEAKRRIQAALNEVLSPF